MSSTFFRAIFTALVLRVCLSYSTGVQLPENTPTVLLQPTKLIKSSLDTPSSGTGVSKYKRGENVRAIEDIRLPASIGVNFYRLPPSPANLLKPDGFQFYTYNERGDMITRQMTMQEIQALIAGGGPDHSNIAIQEPQKVEDTLTGGKKVIDVVEKVQSVLKSAMDKPLSTLTGPHPTIPEKANVEWSNILPAILAGDKYGSKIEESTLTPTATTSAVQNVSFFAESEDNVSKTVSSVTFEQVTGTDQVQNNETTMQTEKNASLAVPSAIMSGIWTSPFTEKIMIPVRVITTEQVVQPTTQSYNVNQITEGISSVDSIQYEHYNHPTEKDSATMDVYDTKSTTAGIHFSSAFEATKNNFDNAVFPNVSSSVDAKETQTNETNPIVADISIGEVHQVPFQVPTSSSLVLNQVQASVSKEPASTGPSMQYTTGTPNRSTDLIKDSSTIDYGTVTKGNDYVVTTQYFKPLSMDLVNSLSSVISQVSDGVSSVLSGPSEFETAPNGNGNEAHDNSSESTVSESRTTTWSPVVIYEDDDSGSTGNDISGENVRDSFAETTLKLAVDGKIFSSTSPESIGLSSTSITEKGIINYSESLTESATSQAVSAVQLSLNMTEGTSSNPPLGIIMTIPSSLDSSEINNVTINNSNSSKPVVIIDSILRTVSIGTATPASESIIIPNTLPDGYLANTFASSLIAGFDSQNLAKTQTAFKNATTSSSENRPLTGTTLDSKLSTLATNNIMTKEELLEHFTQLSNSHDDATTVGTTDQTMLSTQTGTDPLQPLNDFSVISESTTVSTSSLPSSLSLQYTLKPVRVSLVTGNAVSTNHNSGFIGSNLPLDSQKIGEGSELVVEPTVNVSSETGQSLGSVSQEALQKNDKPSVAHFNENMTEISVTERSEQELSINKSEYINATVNSIESEEQDQQHHIIVESLNSTVTPAQEMATATETQHKNETIQSLDTTVTYSDGAIPSAVIHNSTATTNIPKISSEPYVGDCSNETASTKESNVDANVTGTKHTINSTDLDRSENKTEMLVELYESNASTNNPIDSQYLEGSKLESQVKEKLEERENFTLQQKVNGTDITSSHHVWQRISLHQTTPTLPTKFATTTKEPDIQVSAMATTMFETNTIKMETMHLQSTPLAVTESSVSLDASKGSGGLDISTGKASNDIVNFSRLCNELAIKFWIAANKGLSTGRSLALSPFGMISLLAMIFLGARGSTSDQMNEVLGLDNVATFNPHLIFQNVTDTVSLARHQGIANAAFVRELFADKVKVRKLLPFYKEQAQQFYEGLVAEVNFATISDLVRRRTNLLVRKQTGGRIKDFVKSNAVPLRSPLAAISANVFQTDCNTSFASATGRDGELYFAVSSAHRLRKLIPVPATVWRSNVLAGYEPSLDATAIAIGGIDKLVSTIFLLPGQQGHVAPGDTLDRLEQRFVKGAFRDGGWYKLLKVLIPRPGLELQLPKFSHRSVINATAALKRMGLDQLFSNHADFKGINGIGNRLFLSDVLQMNLFSTCGDENIANGRHHVEVYPASPSLRNSRQNQLSHNEETLTVGKNLREIDVHWKSHRGVSMKEGTIIANRAGEKPRLKLDQPFLYFVRHNPTGLILHMGRFNPRLL